MQCRQCAAAIFSSIGLVALNIDLMLAVASDVETESDERTARPASDVPRKRKLPRLASGSRSPPTTAVAHACEHDDIVSDTDDQTLAAVVQEHSDVSSEEPTVAVKANAKTAGGKTKASGNALRSAGASGSAPSSAGVGEAAVARPWSCTEKVVLEIFAGSARLSGACASVGLRIACPIEKDFGSWADVADVRVQDAILGWIRAGSVWYVHLATPCTQWSKARTTGKKPLSMDSLVIFTAAVLREARAAGILFSLENPLNSGLFALPAIARELEKPPAVRVVFDCCAWGACYRKSTELRTNFPKLCSLVRRCSDVPPHTHDQLEGTVTLQDPASGKLVRCWKTRLAGKYVPELCTAWASILLAHATVLVPAAIVPPGEPAMPLCWQTWLSDACNVLCEPLTTPTCPSSFRCEWANALHVWGRHGHVLRRPSSAGPS